MKLQTITYVSASDVFSAIADRMNGAFGAAKVAAIYSEHADVSFGDAGATIITRDRFLSTLEDCSDLPEEVYYEVIDELEDRGINYIDLES